MSRKDYTLMLMVVAVSGLVGGAVTSWLMSGAVTADDTVKQAKTIQAEAIQIVDSNGQVRIELTTRTRKLPKEARVFFRDKFGNQRELKGEERENVNVTGERFDSGPRIEILDKEGKSIWEAPQRTEAMFVR